MLEVKNVSYAYKTKKDKTILNNVCGVISQIKSVISHQLCNRFQRMYVL